jgi:hypothetical protein
MVKDNGDDPNKNQKSQLKYFQILVTPTFNLLPTPLYFQILVTPTFNLLPTPLWRIFWIEIGPLLDQNCRRHGRMAHHVATMLSQIIPLSNKTTIKNDKTASSTMVITICVIDMIILTVGCWGIVVVDDAVGLV